MRDVLLCAAAGGGDQQARDQGPDWTQGDERILLHRKRLQEADRYIRKHYAENISLATLAEQCGLHPNYFHKLYTEAFGITPSQKLLACRIAAAKMALDAAEIATFEPYTEFSLSCSYPDYQKISAELPRFSALIDGTDYADNVIVKFAIKSEMQGKLIDRIREMTAGRSIPEIVGERFDCE